MNIKNELLLLAAKAYRDALGKFRNIDAENAVDFDTYHAACANAENAKNRLLLVATTEDSDIPYDKAMSRIDMHALVEYIEGEGWFRRPGGNDPIAGGAWYGKDGGDIDVLIVEGRCSEHGIQMAENIAIVARELNRTSESVAADLLSEI